MNPAREKVLPGAKLRVDHPIPDCRSRLLGDLELNRPVGFHLDHGGAVAHMASHGHVVDPEANQVATAQLAVDGEIEQREVATPLFELKPDADCPDVQRALLANQAPLIPGRFRKTNKRWDRGAHGLLLDPDHPATARLTPELPSEYES
jgi:hypothetical protein